MVGTLVKSIYQKSDISPEQLYHSRSRLSNKLMVSVVVSWNGKGDIFFISLYKTKIDQNCYIDLCKRAILCGYSLCSSVMICESQAWSLSARQSVLSKFVTTCSPVVRHFSLLLRPTRHRGREIPNGLFSPVVLNTMYRWNMTNSRFPTNIWPYLGNNTRHAHSYYGTHSVTTALDQLRVVASSTSNDPGPRSRQHQQINR